MNPRLHFQDSQSRQSPLELILCTGVLETISSGTVFRSSIPSLIHHSSDIPFVCLESRAAARIPTVFTNVVWLDRQIRDSALLGIIAWHHHEDL